MPIYVFLSKIKLHEGIIKDKWAHSNFRFFKETFKELDDSFIKIHNLDFSCLNWFIEIMNNPLSST